MAESRAAFEMWLDVWLSALPARASPRTGGRKSAAPTSSSCSPGNQLREPRCGCGLHLLMTVIEQRRDVERAEALGTRRGYVRAESSDLEASSLEIVRYRLPWELSPLKFYRAAKPPAMGWRTRSPRESNVRRRRARGGACLPRLRHVPRPLRAVAKVRRPLLVHQVRWLGAHRRMRAHALQQRAEHVVVDCLELSAHRPTRLRLRAVSGVARDRRVRLNADNGVAPSTVAGVPCAGVDRCCPTTNWSKLSSEGDVACDTLDVSERGDAGGRAGAGGFDYQHRGAAWFAVQILAGAAAAPASSSDLDERFEADRLRDRRGG